MQNTHFEETTDEKSKIFTIKTQVGKEQNTAASSAGEGKEPSARMGPTVFKVVNAASSTDEGKEPDPLPHELLPFQSPLMAQPPAAGELSSTDPLPLASPPSAGAGEARTSAAVSSFSSL